MIQIKNMISYDDFGLPVQSSGPDIGDGGDSAQRAGMIAFAHTHLGYPIDNQYYWQLKLLEVSPGIFVRHPGPEHNDPKDLARDQQISLLRGIGASNFKEFLKRMTVAHLKRWGRCQNKDYITPDMLGSYIRAWRAYWLWPLLLFCDLGLVFNSLERCGWIPSIEPDHQKIVWATDPDDVGNDQNHIMGLLEAKFVMSTPWSFLARKIYKKFRHKNYGNTKLGEPDAISGALSWYHRKESGGNPGIAELYKKLVPEF